MAANAESYSMIREAGANLSRPRLRSETHEARHPQTEEAGSPRLARRGWGVAALRIIVGVTLTQAGRNSADALAATAHSAEKRQPL